MTPTKNMTTGLMLFVAAFVISAVALYAGAIWVDSEETASATADDGTAPTGPVSVTLIAQNLTFDKRTIVAGAGVPVTVTLDNRDPGTLHNVGFYTNRSASQTIFKGELFAGPGTRTETFTAPSTPGNFFYRCDAHPDTMTGTFSVR